MTTTPFDLAGKLAFVTGSARGLGNTYSRALAQAGCDVILHGLDFEKEAADKEAAAIADEYGVKAHVITFDVSDSQAVSAGCAQLLEEFGVPDILVNNAGIQRRGPFAEIATEDFDAVIKTNLCSVFYVSQPIVRKMIERGSGKIVNIGSINSKLARPTISPYCAAKGGIQMLTQSMATDLAQFNIQVNAMSPGYFKTELNTALMADAEFNAWVEKRTPAGRWGDVEELVSTLLFLCAPGSGFVTGQNILVDGGVTSAV